MCSLPEHTARSAREHEAQAQEPIYTALARERGVQYEPPSDELPRSGAIRVYAPSSLEPTTGTPMIDRKREGK